MSGSRFTRYLAHIRSEASSTGQRVPYVDLFQVAALLIACAAAWPLLADPGLLNTRGGGDSPFLLQRLQQMETALGDGHFPVRWMPDANYGYGYPFFNFYAPLSIYVAAAFRFLGFSYVHALELTQLLGFATAAWAMFHLARRWLGSNWAGLLAAVAYTLAPFHMVNVYVRGDSLAEFWAMAFYPLTILVTDNLFRAWRQQRVAGKRLIASTRRPLALFALAYAALILSHNISALIFTPFLLLYIGLRWWHVRRSTRLSAAFSSLVPLLLGFLLALALAAWFFVPALAERSLAQLGPVTEGYFHFSQHFRDLDLVQSGVIFDYDPTGGRAFRMGLVQAVTAVAGLVTLWITAKSTVARAEGASRPAASTCLFVTISLLLATIMITSLSRPLWQSLPLLPFTQFPWRFLSVQAFAAALAAGGLALLPGRRFIVSAVIILLLVGAFGGLQADHLIIADADVTAERLAQYEWFTGNIGSTVSAEYLPPTVQPRPYTSDWLETGQRARAKALAGRLTAARQTSQLADRQAWRLTATDPGATVMFPTLYWPGWEAAIDGERVPVQPSAGSGLITLDLPPGEHAVTLHLRRTPIRLVAEFVSLAAVMAVVWLLASGRLLKSRRAYVYGGAFLLLLALGLRLWPQRVLPAGNLTWDFAQMGYLHHDVGGVFFDNGSWLESYAYSDDVVAAGEDLIVRLSLNPGGGGQARLALVTPAANRFHGAPVLSHQSQVIDNREVTYRLAIPDNAPAGLIVPRLTMEHGRPLMPSGQPRGELFLRPLRITSAATEVDQVGEAGLDVRPVQVQARHDDTLDVQLAWRTGQPLSHNYKTSLRLIDVDGRQLAQFDSQPGYGFQPSSTWPVAQWVNDWLALPLPPARSGEPPYALVVRLYQAETGTAVLTRHLGELAPSNGRLAFRESEPTFTLPETLTAYTAVFERDDTTPIIRLHGYTIANQQTGQPARRRLTLTLYWRALEDMPVGYTRFVHLVDPASGQPVAQDDAMPRHNSYPTGQWLPGEVVADPLTLDLSDVPEGEYQIVVGFYLNLGDNFPRLTAVDANGEPFPEDRVSLPVTVTVPDNE